MIDQKHLYISAKTHQTIHLDLGAMDSLLVAGSESKTTRVRLALYMAAACTKEVLQSEINALHARDRLHPETGGRNLNISARKHPTIYTDIKAISDLIGGADHTMCVRLSLFIAAHQPGPLLGRWLADMRQRDLAGRDHPRAPKRVGTFIAAGKYPKLHADLEEISEKIPGLTKITRSRLAVFIASHDSHEQLMKDLATLETGQSDHDGEPLRDLFLDTKRHPSMLSDIAKIEGLIGTNKTTIIRLAMSIAAGQPTDVLRGYLTIMSEREIANRPLTEVI